VDWNATGAEYPRDLCLHQLIERQAAATPNAVACVMAGEAAAEDRSLSYRELDSKANQLANALRKTGIEPRQRVGIFVDVQNLYHSAKNLYQGFFYIMIQQDYQEHLHSSGV
jgi:non-ribosomal peptide synthetase component F